MKIKPLNDWAVIVPSEAETKTAGGLYIPDTAKEKPAEGVVEAIGPGALEEEGYGKKKKEKKDRKFIPTSVKPGERVLYESFSGQKITVGGADRVLVRERNILGVLPPKQERPNEELPPLQLPSATTAPTTTAIAKRPAQTAITKVKPKAGTKKGPGTKGKGPSKAKKK